jgi:hypothetical protein
VSLGERNASASLFKRAVSFKLFYREVKIKKKKKINKRRRNDP